MSHPVAQALALASPSAASLGELLSDILCDPEIPSWDGMDDVAWSFIQNPTPENLTALRGEVLSRRHVDVDVGVVVGLAAQAVVEEPTLRGLGVKALADVSHVAERSLEPTLQLLVDVARRSWHEFEDGLFDSPISDEVLQAAHGVVDAIGTIPTTSTKS